MKRNEDAVSPVVGVMLMLVVTIIIAAVVSGFAGGLAGGTKAAPQASIDVRFMQDDGGMRPANVQWKMVFEHLSGDSIPTKDLEIVTYYTLTDGTHNKTQTDTSKREHRSLRVWNIYQGALHQRYVIGIFWHQSSHGLW